MKKKQIFKFILAVFGACVLVLLDRLSKIWAETVLRPNGPITLIKGVLELQWTKNEGIAFGLFQGMGIVFIILTVLLSGVLVLFLFRIPATKRFLPLNIIFTVILGGALGNLWDRVFQSYVTDFIYIKLINFPIFNVADICVSLGIVALLFYLLFFYKDKELKEVFSLKKKKAEEEDSREETVPAETAGEEDGKSPEEKTE